MQVFERLLKSLEINVNKIYELFSTAKDAQIKSAKQMEDVCKFMEFINEKFDEFEADRKEKEREIAELRNNLEYLKEHLSKTNKTSDCREQYSRRSCLLVHDVEEESNEDN